MVQQVGYRNYEADRERERKLAPMGYEPEEQTFIVRDFKGVNIQANRTGISEEEFAWLENILPIGHANLRAVPQQGSPIATLPVAGLSSWQYANINNTDYLYAFMSNGAAYQVRLIDGAQAAIGGASTFTLPAALAQWKNERIVICAQNAQFNWNGTTLNNDSATVSITGKIDNGSGSTGTILTVTVAGANAVAPGQAITGSGVTAGTQITGYLSGTGGTGTYSVNTSQLVASAEALTLTATAPAGTTIASFAGRIWSAQGRTVNFTAPNTYTDYTAGDAGGSFIVTDETLRSSIERLMTANNFLYIVGSSSINVLSDVRVIAGTPATTIFSNANVTANIGSTFPYSLFSWYRLVMLATPYGFYVLSGSTPQKVSTPLDNLLPSIDFTQPVTGGMFNVFGILGAAFLFTYKDPGTLPGSTPGSRPLIALYFDKKWSFASQGGGLTQITGAFVNGVPQLYGTDGQNIWQLFSNTTNTISTTIQSALWPMKSSWENKHVLRAGIEVNNPLVQQISLSISVDNEYGSAAQSLMAQNSGGWINNAGVQGFWINNAAQQGQWVIPGYSIFQGDAQQIGRYIGMTLQSTVPGYTVQGLLLAYTRGARWAGRPGS